jgi:Bacteriophage tail sheath protein
MATYFSPGVYVEEVPSSVKAIAGAGTSTAGFIGVVPNSLVTSTTPVTAEAIGAGDGTKKAFDLKNYPVLTDAATFQMRVAGVPTAATLSNNDTTKKSQVTFAAAPAAAAVIEGDYAVATTFSPVAAGEPKLCTNFTEFKKFFGDFAGNKDHNYLVHAVYGFFNNGGSRCFVMRVLKAADIPKLLPNFEAIDEIAIVAAPGITDATTRSEIDIHCRIKTQDRFAILDSNEVVETAGSLDTTLLTRSNVANVLPPNSDFAAFYFPWIQVFDPIEKQNNPKGDGLIFVPPSGHIAGVYARVDTERGVHKAPANAVLMGALGLKYRVSKALQDGLNPQGVNCIRDMNGNIRVWGARTAGGDANADLKYVNVRRTLLFLRESIDEGTQWVVFEPNTPALWQSITRNVSAFLTNVWRAGALFGNTPQEAFYVKCDAETNPPELRELGQVVTEIGVAIVRPAEFVIFRISQVPPLSK